jgi:hypothetical protein
MVWPKDQEMHAIEKVIIHTDPKRKGHAMGGHFSVRLIVLNAFGKEKA